jgi:hypothetical protein
MYVLLLYTSEEWVFSFHGLQLLQCGASTGSLFTIDISDVCIGKNTILFETTLIGPRN